MGVMRAVPGAHCPLLMTDDTTMAMACCLRRQLILLLSLIIACFGLSPLSVVLYSTAGSGGRRQISSCADQGSTTKAYSWIDRVYQLIEYRDLHGDTLVPKRHADNPALGNWVNKQRQEYKKGSLTGENQFEAFETPSENS